MATIWGMSVIFTFLPEIHAAAAPTARATTMRPRFFSPGTRKVPATATTMPTPAQTMPFLAVAGELMPLRPKMKRSAPRNQGAWT